MMDEIICRQEALEAINRIWDKCEEIEAHLPEGDPDKTGYKMISDYLTVWKYLSAQPERKTGRWITKLENHTYECSECGNGIITNKDYLKKHKFCFCCGAKMLKEGEG